MSTVWSGGVLMFCVRLSPRILTCAALLGIVGFLSGCTSGPDIAEVEGHVTLDGAPLERAYVVFLPSGGGRPGTARTDANGRYELRFDGARKGALIGRHEVRVYTYYPPSKEFDADGKMVSI